MKMLLHAKESFVDFTVVGSCVYVIGSGASPIKFRDSSQAGSYYYLGHDTTWRCEWKSEVKIQDGGKS